MSIISQDPLVRAGHFVGDFGSPFYGEERQRDVWNEAQAFGLQLAVWATLTAATITVWSVAPPCLRTRSPRAHRRGVPADRCVRAAARG